MATEFFYCEWRLIDRRNAVTARSDRDGGLGRVETGADENFSEMAVDALRTLGHDVRMNRNGFTQNGYSDPAGRDH
jgi:hypothetical protein